MGATQSRITANSNNTSIQSSYNSQFYNNEVICGAKCENIQSNIYVVIENSTTGNINFNQTCNTQLNCIQENQIEFLNNTQASSKQFTESESTLEEGIIPTIGYNSRRVTANASNYSLQSIYNMTNINITKNCQSSSLNIQSDIFTIIKDSTTGDINFTQSGNATASCISTNSAKVSNYNILVNDQTAKSKATASVKGFMGLFLLFIAFIFIIIFIFIKISGSLKNVIPPPGIGKDVSPSQIIKDFKPESLDNSNIELNKSNLPIKNKEPNLENKVSTENLLNVLNLKPKK